MRTIIRIAALTVALILPAAALAVDFESIDGVADCNGWNSDVRVWIRDGATFVQLEYVVILTDADGNEVQRFEHGEVVPTETGFVDYKYEGTWDTEPGDGWNVTGDFTLIDVIPDLMNFIHGEFTTTVDCAAADDGDEQEELACTYPARWWLRHTEAWPVDELEIGGMVLDEAQLYHMLRRRAWGRPLVLLAQQLIAAKFNAMMVPDHGMDRYIGAADAYLADNPPVPQRRRGRHSADPIRVQVRMVRGLAGPLIVFNWPGCYGGEEDATGTTTGASADVVEFAKALEAEPIPEDNVSFGAIKSMYR